MPITRREFLTTAAAAAAYCITPTFAAANQKGEQYVTNFYQFGAEATKRLPQVLPSGKNFLHIMAHSSPGKKPRPKLAQMTRAGGASFKFAHPIDVHKYENWETAPADQLKKWAIEFREGALDPQVRADL